MQALQKLNKLISDSLSAFSKIADEQWNKKPLPAKWSKKEILGHLIDSAINNEVRIVKSVAVQAPLLVEGYMQNEWVNRNNYQAQSPSTVIEKWKIHQESISNLIENITPDELQNKCFLPDGRKETLQWLIDDYVRHQEHHLNQILGNNAGSYI